MRTGPRSAEILPLAALALVTTVSTFPWALHGMNWTDASHSFHFAARLLDGDFPYRDYVYQVGFLPILGDALWQSIIGERYLASVLAAFLAKAVLVLSAYVALRQFAPRGQSAATAAGLALSFPILLHAGHLYVATLGTIAVALLAVALRRSGTAAATIACALVGASLSAIVAVRQSAGVLALALGLGFLAWCALREGRRCVRGVLAPALLGAAVGVTGLAGVLMAHGALGSAAAQMFLDAPEKKGISSGADLLEASLGGIEPSDAFGLVAHNLLPLVLAAAALAAIASRRDLRLGRARIPAGSAAHVGLLGLFVAGVLAAHYLRDVSGPGFQRFAELATYDVPRMLALVVAGAAIVSPHRLAQTSRVPALFLGFVAMLALANVLALQLSWPGRAYVSESAEVRNLALLVFMLLLLGTALRVPWRLRRTAPLAFLAAVAVIFATETVDGSIAVPQFDGDYRIATVAVPDERLRGIRVRREKARALRELKRRVRPGDSCFVYGSAPALYTLLECRNPTRIDVLYWDFYTLDDARAAARALDRSPPRWVISTSAAAPPLRPDDGSPEFYGPFSPDAPRFMHGTVRHLLRDYDLTLRAAELFAHDPPLLTGEPDRIAQLRLYSRRGGLPPGRR